MHSNVQLIKQNKTKMCRLREDWAQWIDLGLILLESVLLFEVTHYSVNFATKQKKHLFTQTVCLFWWK